MIDKEVSCFDCRYYQAEQYVCMKLYRTSCILNEWEKAKGCKDFVQGEYDEGLIEKEYWSR